MSEIRRLSCMMFLIIISIFESQSLIIYGKITNQDLVNEIDIKINNAFEAILKAEKTGAEINALVNDMNEAISLYRELKIAIEEGDSEKAFLTSKECVSISSKVEDEAYSISISVASQAKIRQKRAFIISRCGTLTTLIFSLFIWYKFKQYYMDRALRMKPQVVDDEP